MPIHTSDDHSHATDEARQEGGAGDHLLYTGIRAKKSQGRYLLFWCLFQLERKRDGLKMGTGGGQRLAVLKKSPETLM